MTANIYLLIYLISLQAGQQPTVEKIHQSTIAGCEAEGKRVVSQLRHPGCDGVKACTVPYIVRTACVVENAGG